MSARTHLAFKKVCCASVYEPHYFFDRRCGYGASVERDGKYYCGVHDPVKRKAKSDALSADFANRQIAARKVRDSEEAQRFIQRLDALLDDPRTLHNMAEAIANEQRTRAGIKPLSGRQMQEIDPLGWERVLMEAWVAIDAIKKLTLPF